MYLVAIAWAYVALMMAAAEALSPQGTLLGATITLLLYGALPLGLLMYILGTPGRRRRAAQQQQQQQQSLAATTPAAPAAAATAAQDSAQRDAGRHAAPGPTQSLPAEREES